MIEKKELNVKILFAGESWSILSTHTKGFDHVSLGRYHEAKDPIKKALEKENIEVEYMPSHIAHYEFPHEMKKLKEYDAVMLSDIGSNTFLLHPDTQFQCKRMPNRLSLIKDYVSQGGGLVMCGGYMSFSGNGNKARYGMTPLAEVLPVEILNYDDRIERPEGVFPTIVDESHTILKGVSNEWPDFLGYNKIKAKPQATEIAKFGEDTFMAGMQIERGRSFAFASDCVPHWGPTEFIEWESYSILWSNILKWTAGKI